jgi:hypothetical protein
MSSARASACGTLSIAVSTTAIAITFFLSMSVLRHRRQAVAPLRRLYQKELAYFRGHRLWMFQRSDYGRFRML